MCKELNRQQLYFFNFTTTVMIQRRQAKILNSVTKAMLKAEHSLQVRLVTQSYTNTDGQVPKSY